MLRSLQAEKLRELENSWSQEYDRLVNLSGTDRLNLDLSRGKPSPDQLEDGPGRVDRSGVTAGQRHGFGFVAAPVFGVEGVEDAHRVGGVGYSGSSSEPLSSDRGESN